MSKSIVLSLIVGGLLASCSAGPQATTVPGERLPVEIDSVDVLLLESYPVQLRLHVSGWLPNQCSTPTWTVTDPLESGDPIRVDLYAVPQSSEACIQVLAPFEVSIPLGAVEGRQVLFNGEVVIEG